VVDAFLSEKCTLLVPAFTSPIYLVAPPIGMRPAQNAWDYERPLETYGEDRIYSPLTNEINAWMGKISRAVLERAGRVRGEHPLNSFAAIGPQASELLEHQAPLNVYAPLQALAEAAGYVLLVGVGLTSMTLLHAAELHAGRRLFIRWANGPDGQPIRVQTGSCSNGFEAFEPIFARLVRETHVGLSRWRAYPGHETLMVAAGAIRDEPEITRCDDPECERCRDMVAGGPLLPS
jgi:aminoglycoside 3-N-acetyltransferase